MNLAYVAGFFDGEGCVNFTHSGQCKTCVLRVMIRNTDLDIIQQIHRNFGGRIETLHHKNPTFKISYCWRIDGSRAVDFLRLIDKFVIIKKDQISVAMCWDIIRNRSRGTRRDEEYRGLIDLLVKQLQWLNRKGPRQIDDLEPMAEVLKTVPPKYLEELGLRHALN